MSFYSPGYSSYAGGGLGSGDDYYREIERRVDSKFSQRSAEASPGTLRAQRVRDEVDARLGHSLSRNVSGSRGSRVASRYGMGEQSGSSRGGAVGTDSSRYPYGFAAQHGSSTRTSLPPAQSGGAFYGSGGLGRTSSRGGQGGLSRTASGRGSKASSRPASRGSFGAARPRTREAGIPTSYGTKADRGRVGPAGAADEADGRSRRGSGLLRGAGARQLAARAASSAAAAASSGYDRSRFGGGASGGGRLDYGRSEYDRAGEAGPGGRTAKTTGLEAGAGGAGVRARAGVGMGGSASAPKPGMGSSGRPYSGQGAGAVAVGSGSLGGEEREAEGGRPSRRRAGAASSGGGKADPGAFSAGVTSGTVPPLGARPSAPRGLVGLQNEGNTCFLNSVLQCLSNVPELTALFIDGRAPSVNPGSATRGRLAAAYGELLGSMWSAQAARRPMALAQRPSAVKRVVGRVAKRFLGYEQQDAHEFLRFFVESLSQDLRRGRGKPPFREMKDPPGAADAEVAREWWSYDEEREGSPVRDIFAGQLRGVVECQRCGYTSRSFDSAWDLQLPIPRKAQRGGGGGLFGFGARSGGGGCSLGDCLDEYTGEERMRGEGTWRCSKCKASDSVRRTQLWRLPTVLVLQFKRFTFSTFRRSKVSTSVAMPGKALDVGPYLAKGAPGAGPGRRPVYELIGASNHSGSIHGGHYTADCRNHDDGRWYRFNDSHVSASNGVSGSAAYIAFYRLVGADSSGSGGGGDKGKAARL